MYIVDIDTGGTMTDCLVTGNGGLISLKVDTTPHDFTVSFHACLEEAARALDFAGSGAFLDHVDLIRWSSTITTNVLGERRGAKVGLLVREGHEQDLYGTGPSPALGWMVAQDNVLGLPEQPTMQDLLARLKKLLERGVRRVCICLPRAYPDNAAEIAIRDLIEQHYPDHFLGAVPVLLGSEMAQISDDNSRVHSSLINAYTHTQLAMSLFKAEDLLKERDGWDGPLLIGQTSGGVARIGKTKAVDTIESSPIFGAFGAAFLAGQYGIANAICLDVGGTTTKASIAVDGKPLVQRGGTLIGVPVSNSLTMLRSAVLGGGSVARPTGADGVSLGPHSMGAAPGPACYGLGGDQATLTDALLLLGYLDPNGFLGGRRALRADLSEQAITTHVAGPLGVPAPVAADRIVAEAVRMIADLIAAILGEAGIDPAASSMIAYGGNGPLFGGLVAQRLHIDRIFVPSLAPVLSAFGSAISDVLHVYEMGIGGRPGDARAAIEAAARKMLETATRDLRGEGFDPTQARFDFEVDARTPDDLPTTVAIAPEHRSPEAIAAGVAAGESISAIDLLRLNCRLSVGGYRPTEKPIDGTRLLEGLPQRAIRIGGKEYQAAVVGWDGLEGGDRVAGPAIVAGGSLTCLVPDGLKLLLDGFGNGQIQ